MWMRENLICNGVVLIRWVNWFFVWIFFGIRFKRLMCRGWIFCCVVCCLDIIIMFLCESMLKVGR